MLGQSVNSKIKMPLHSEVLSEKGAYTVYYSFHTMNRRQVENNFTPQTKKREV